MNDEKPKVRMQVMFATPFAEVRMPEPEPILAELSALLIERESELYRDPVRRPTQHGVFESRFDLFDWPETPVRKLAEFCRTSLDTIVRSLNDYDDAMMAQLRWHIEAWFHVTRKGGFQGLHQHQNHSWSGIFCVDPGDVVPDHPLSGVVRFHDPRMHVTMHEDSANQRLHPPFTTGGFDLVHEPGKLVVMPSYLHHEIFPYMGERPRIVVAFNARASWATS